jgi:hypothetical protein
MRFADRSLGRLAASAGAALGTALAVLAAGAAAEEPDWKPVNPARFDIVSQFAPTIQAPLAHAETNRLGGQTIMVSFRYQGDAFALVVYSESPKKLAEPSMVAATQQALSTNPLFKDGAFAPGELGSADSPLGPFSYQLVHAQQPVEDRPLLTCAVFQHLRSGGMSALTGFFCDKTDSFTPTEVSSFFATLGIRGIALPK